MHKPDYIPTLTPREFWQAWHYAPCTSTVWCFICDVMKMLILGGRKSCRDKRSVPAQHPGCLLYAAEAPWRACAICQLCDVGGLPIRAGAGANCTK